MRAVADHRGQASIELIGILPIALLVVLAVAQLLAAGAAQQSAQAAAAAGAMARLQGGDPARAARAAAPGWARGQLDVAVDGGRVTVAVTPRTLLPGAATLLTAHARADAGPRA